MKTMHGFILNWRETEESHWVARSLVCFEADKETTDFIVTYEGEHWASYMGDEWLDDHDDKSDAMAECEARFVKWAMPAVHRTDCQNHEAAIKVMKRLGRDHLVSDS